MFEQGLLLELLSKRVGDLFEQWWFKTHRLDLDKWKIQKQQVASDSRLTASCIENGVPRCVELLFFYVYVLISQGNKIRCCNFLNSLLHYYFQTSKTLTTSVPISHTIIGWEFYMEGDCQVGALPSDCDKLHRFVPLQSVEVLPKFNGS